MKKVKLGNILCNVLEFLGEVVITVLEALEADDE
jgi:hypothetical protein